jgi:hypothetical protein
MKSAIAFATALLLALLFTFSAAHAGTAGTATAQPQVVLQAWQVQSVVELGATRESLQPLKGIRPGDVVEYEARYVNTTAKAAQHVQLTLPVPVGGLAYLPQAGAATPVDSASVDGVRFEPVPLRREVRLPDGRRVTQDVPLADYRFLRWNLGTLPAGAERAVRARMQLPAVTTTASR